MSTGYQSRTKITASYTGNRLLSAFIAGALVLSAILLTALPAFAATSPLLNSNQVGSSDITAFTKWTALMPRYEQQRAAADDKCIGQGCQNHKWEALMTELADKPQQEQVEKVSKFFNSMKYVSDKQNYGVTDYWNSPYELMERGGDCEDYAIAKYISLKRLGVSESEMRILIVKDQKLGGEIHAVLEVKVDEVAVILDNQAKLALPEAKINHYQPVYAINEAKWWAYR
jgi:predicted transglutaminase-like cysteine proteinase